MEVVFRYHLSKYKILDRESKPNWRPLFHAIIKGSNGLQTFDEKFLLDSGASMTILNSNVKAFISKLTPVDFFTVQYGSGGRKRLPVYKVSLIIQGHEIQILAAYDQSLHSSEHLFGMTEGLDVFDLIILNNNQSEKSFKLIRKLK